MAYIEVVIKIPEEVYNIIKESREPMILAERLIKKGTLLPKGHGDLIDRNELLKHHDSKRYFNGIEERKIHFVQIGYVNDAPIVIEADKAESEVQDADSN